MFFTSMLVGGLIGFLVGCIIDANTVREKVRDDGKIYALIKKKQRNTLTMDEIDEYGHSTKVTMSSEEGISSDIRVGQRIYA